MSNDLQCPIDFVTVNENQARLTALQVLILTIVWLPAGYVIIPAFLIADFLLRAGNLGKYSLLNNSSVFFIKKFSIANKPVDRGPKRFAAFVGFLFAIAILIFFLADIVLISKILAAVLAVFASLEAFAGFCAGCYVYTFFSKTFLKANS